MKERSALSASSSFSTLAGSPSSDSLVDVFDSEPPPPNKGNNTSPLAAPPVKTSWKVLGWNWAFGMAFLFTIMTILNKLVGTKVGGGLYGNLDCDQSLAEGAFLISHQERSTRWRTNACFFHYRYSQLEIETCLKSSSSSNSASFKHVETENALEESSPKPSRPRSILFVGDSILRQLYLTLEARLNGGKIRQVEEGDLHFEKNGLFIEFLWDPFLNRSDWFNYKNEQDRPVLTMISSGIAYMQQNPESPLSGIETLISQISDITQMMPPTQNNTNTFFRLIPYVIQHNISPSLKKILKNRVIEKYNEAIVKEFGHKNPRKSIHIAVAANKIFESVVHQIEGSWKETLWETIKSESAKVWVTKAAHDGEELAEADSSPSDQQTLDYETAVIGALDGITYESPVMNSELDLILNQICNSKIFGNDRLGRMSESATCCVDYPKPKWKQIVALLILAFVGPFAYLMRKILCVSRIQFVLDFFLPSLHGSVILSTIFFSVLYPFFTDRTSLFLKTNNDYSGSEYTILIILCLFPGFLTLTQTSKSKSRTTSILNENQLSEWKGWMQLVILAYHITGASQYVSVYVIFRLLISSYLFITGYEQSYCLLTIGKNGAFREILKTLIRLNLIPIILSYTMNRSILFYYFGPLVSFWVFALFLVVRVGSRWNSSVAFLFGKLILGALTVSYCIYHEDIFSGIFSVMERVLGVKGWNADRARFILGMDVLIVWFGMAVAILRLKFASLKEGQFDRMDKSLGASERSYKMASWLSANHQKVLGPMAAFFLVIYTHLLLTTGTKATYHRLHPYLSPFPILSYAYLRNVTPLLRRSYSSCWVWLGNFSMETFALQYHMWMAMDAKGVLVVAPGAASGSVFLNFLVTTVVLLWIADRCSRGINLFARWFVDGESHAFSATPPKKAKQGGDYEAVTDSDDESFNLSSSSSSLPTLAEMSPSASSSSLPIVPSKITFTRLIFRLIVAGTLLILLNMLV